MKRLVTVLLACVLVCAGSAQTLDSSARSRITSYLQKYESNEFIYRVRLSGTSVSQKTKTVEITLSNNFARQLFRTETVSKLYSDIRKLLPAEYSKYTLRITSNGKLIDNLVPNRYREFADQELLWNGKRYLDAPWTTNESQAYKVTRGLSGIHISVTPSHGLYYQQEDSIWKWQRPPLFCTREDLLTQSFVYPYLIPMLENAGAVAIPMRERDWQTASVIADDAGGRKEYQESAGRNMKWKTVKGTGYSYGAAGLGTGSQQKVRTNITGTGSTQTYASASWIPDIPRSGSYAVYVTYSTFENSVTDARYIVSHKGGSTVFRVNQRIGGGTWVYLGTFEFEKGRSQEGMVTLDNSSSEEGIVCADAVRFGGGMGNEPRGGMASGKARYLEGSRYYAIFDGAPESVYLKFDGTDDYREDIQARPQMTNWLAGGSIFNPEQAGKNVPVELSFALHTDAGYRSGDSIVGTLGICTTKLMDGVLATGLSRDVSRDLADQVLSELRKDIGATTGHKWTIRGVTDDNYAETREPVVPSILVELLSHQNFYDLKYAFDPNFRFTASRSMYKAILKYVTFMHGQPYTVQPLPVSHFAITANEEQRSLTLSWQPELDPLEPSARPDGYIVYTRVDDGGFDNGTAVRHPYYEFSPEPGHLYSFKVTAINSGGQSMPSETLAAQLSRHSKGTILIVNGFQRLSGPASVETPTRQGFDLEADPGVQYISSPILCGYQQGWDRRNIGSESEGGLGFSDDTFDGMLLAGNSFDYPAVHGRAIASGGEYSFVSCSREALEDSIVSLSDYPMADIILGLQKSTPNDTLFMKDHSTFNSHLRRQIEDYSRHGGKLLVSGSYPGSDLASTAEGRQFAQDVLKIKWINSVKTGAENSVNGLGGKYDLTVEPGEQVYQLVHPDVIEPVKDAIAVFAYGNSRFCAGVAWKDGRSSTVTLGFPIESIKGDKLRGKVMVSLINYLMN